MIFVKMLIIALGASAEWVELPKLRPAEPEVATVRTNSDSVEFNSKNSNKKTYFISLLKGITTTASPRAQSVPTVQGNATGQRVLLKKVTKDSTEDKVGSKSNQTNGSTDDEKNWCFKNCSNGNSFFNANLQATLLKVHKTLKKEADQPIGMKINFLEKLQNRLLNNIKRNSQFLWPQNEEGRGHSNIMGFPSLEGALMTISFLTFAVFLIKIVKQFIQGLQGANTNMVGIDIPATVVTPARITRHKREREYEVAGKIFQYIENFKMHHKL